MTGNMKIPVTQEDVSRLEVQVSLTAAIPHELKVATQVRGTRDEFPPPIFPPSKVPNLEVPVTILILVTSKETPSHPRLVTQC